MTEIQCKLRELYSKKEDKSQDPMQFVTPGDQQNQCTLLALSESTISIDQGLRQQMMAELRDEE